MPRRCLVSEFSLANDAGLQRRYDVGFDVRLEHDRSRSFRGGARPLQMLMWYPSTEGASRCMQVCDYVDLLDQELRHFRTQLSQRSREWRERLQPRLNEPMQASRGTPPAQGPFPLLIYAPSFSANAWENADLCEDLACLGYVVLASSSSGVESRSMTADVDGIDAQARDISFLIDLAATLPHVDSSRVGVIGYSWGGISNVVAAARDTRIKALVLLDGSARYFSAVLHRFDEVKLERMTIPMAYFAQAAATLTLEDQDRCLKQNGGPNILNAWRHGDILIGYMATLPHMGFGAFFQRNRLVWSAAVTGQCSSELAEGPRAYRAVSAATARFLGAYLQKDREHLQWLAEQPPHRTHSSRAADPMDLVFRKALPLPVSQTAFSIQISDFDSLGRLYDQARQAHRDFELSESFLEDWAEQLLDQGRPEDATKLLHFGVSIRPRSAAAWAALGRASRLSGDVDRARECYARARCIDPDDRLLLALYEELSGLRVHA